MHTLEQLKNGALAGSDRLRLSCGLTEFPREIFDLADTLEILDLSGNALSALPDDLPRLTRLRILFCSHNLFTALPAMLGACEQLTMIGFKSNRIGHVPASAFPPALRWLILTDNRIPALPASIGRCTQLQKLMLAGNHLTALPPELAACTQLELLRVAANRLAALPAWLADMPRLAWLAFAGNPCSEADEAAVTDGAHPAAIAWRALRLEQVLGEGASGVIYRAAWRRDGAAGRDALPVAVKLFKGAMTSDGLPRCEMAACIGAGPHPHLIPVLGKVVDHPDRAQGCVMGLIDPAFGNLAGPPSLDSCTRDIYPDGKRFTLGALLRLAGGIAAAAAQLHERGILHGDLYAHNILHTEDGDALLGDFGAASMVAPGAAQAAAFARLETRAFGLLLGELLARCDDDAASRAALRGSLLELARACVGDIAHRPALGDIAARLEAVAAGIADLPTA